MINGKLTFEGEIPAPLTLRGTRKEGTISFSGNVPAGQTIVPLLYGTWEALSLSNLLLDDSLILAIRTGEVAIQQSASSWSGIGGVLLNGGSTLFTAEPSGGWAGSLLSSGQWGGVNSAQSIVAGIVWKLGNLSLLGEGAETLECLVIRGGALTRAGTSSSSYACAVLASGSISTSSVGQTQYAPSLNISGLLSDLSTAVFLSQPALLTTAGAGAITATGAANVQALQGQKLLAGLASLTVSSTKTFEGQKLASGALALGATSAQVFEGQKLASGALALGATSAQGFEARKLSVGTLILGATSAQVFEGQKLASGALALGATSAQVFEGQKLTSGALALGATSAQVFAGETITVGEVFDGELAITALAVSGVEAGLLLAAALAVESSTSQAFDATVILGPEGPEAIIPISILESTNLAGNITAIQDDPNAPDAAWLTYVAVEATSVRVAMGQPTFSPTGAQTLQVLVRPNGPGTNNPSVTIALWVNGSAVSTLLNNASTPAQTVYSLNFNAALIPADGSGVEILVNGSRSGGGPSARRTLEVGAIRWTAVQA